MRPFLLSLLLQTPLLLLAACGSDEEAPSDPCRGVVCLRGQECVKGQCVDRTEPEPQGCQSNADCLFNPAGELCDRQSGNCVACFTNGHCPDGRSCEAGQCVGSVCNTHEDCGADAPYCNEAGNACLACLEDEHCGEDERCEKGTCLPPPPACEVDADCEDEEAPFCLEGACVACLADPHCGEEEACAEDGSCQSSLCEEDEDCAAFPGRSCRNGACRPGECDTSADCTDSERPFCVENLCVLCTETEGCGLGEVCVGGEACEPAGCDTLADCPVGSICDDGKCLRSESCTESSECLDPRAPLCVDGRCASCATNADCGPWELCREGACGPFDTCTSDAGCDGGFVCDEGACVACRHDGNCPRGVCVEGACVDAPECTSDVDCAEGVCAGGSCVECAVDVDCRPGAFCEVGRCVAGPDCGEGLLCPPGEICEEGSCVPSGCEDDAFEPDQGPGEAWPIALRSVASRTLCPGDEDWFVFTSLPGMLVEVSLIQGPEDLDIALVWYGAGDGSQRFERRGTKGMIAGSLPAAYGDRYYLRVRSNGESAEYALMVELATGCSDGFEPNDNANQAAPLEAGRLYEGLRPCGMDHYTLEVPAGARAQLFTFFEDGIVDLQVFHGGTLIPATITDIGERGGGRAVSVAAAGADRTLIFRVLVPGAGPAPGHYGLYAAVEPLALCEEGDALLSSLDSQRFRLQGTTAGSDLFVHTPCGEFFKARTYEVEIDEEKRFLAELSAGYQGARLALMDSSCGSNFYCHVGVGETSFLDVAGLASGSYVLVVGAGQEAGGWYDLAVRMEEPLIAPSNDLCEDATLLDLSTPQRVEGTTLGARSDFQAACEIPSPDAFYRFELDEDARVIFEFEGAMPHTLVLIEDGCGDPHAPTSPCWSDPYKELELPAGSYRLGVLASSGRGGDFELGMMIVETPENDLCEDATPILSSDPIAGDTTWGHDESSYPLGQSCTGYLLDGHDVFYSIELEEGETITVKVEPSPDYDVAVYIRESCESGAACLAGADEALKGGEEVLPFTAPADGTYLIVVDGALGGGAFQLIVE